MDRLNSIPMLHNLSVLHFPNVHNVQSLLWIPAMLYVVCRVGVKGYKRAIHVDVFHVVCVVWVLLGKI